MSALLKEIQISDCFEPNSVMTKGTGAPVVYLHGLYGQEWSGMLDDLAVTHSVFAPAHAGSSEPDELSNLDNIFDLVIYYDDLFNQLGFDQVDLIGHSFGGMIAAEFASIYPGRVRKLILIDPLGLWRDDEPVADFLLISPERRAEILLGDFTRADVQVELALPDDPESKMAETVKRITTLASISHFLWPIPERGLQKRLRRVTADTLILWGRDDAFVPSSYAKDFASKIPRSKVEIIDGAGHTPQFDKPKDVSDLVQGFLA